jgi:hypothetical protein
MEETTTPVESTPVETAPVSNSTAASRSKLLILALGVGAIILAALGTAYYLFVYESEPEQIVFNSYDCADGSFYTVLLLDDSIGVAGKIYDLVSNNEDGTRYEGPWPLAFTLSDSALAVSIKESGEPITTCTQGEFKGMPSTGV